MKPDHRKFISEHYRRKSAKQLAKQLGLKERTVSRYIDTLKQKKEDKQEIQEEKTKAPKVKLFWPYLIVIALVGFFVYFNMLKGEFIWDDHILVTNNTDIKSWDNLPQVLTGNLGGERLYYKHSSFRPVQTLTYMVDYTFWKLNPYGFRLTNALIHALTGVSLLLMIFTLLRNNLIAFITALFWVVHPIHTEAVAYIAGRADPLSALFMMLSLTCYIKYLDAKKIWWVALFSLTYMLGILSRENALMVPIFALVIHFAFKRKIDFKGIGTYAVIAVVYIIMRKMEILGNMALKEVVETTVMQRIPGFLVALTGYMKMMVLPFQLHMEYGRPLFKMSDPKAVIGLLIFIALVFCTVFTRKRNQVIYFGLLWFFVALFPVSNTFVVVNAYMAEHWLYLPSIGLLLIAAYGIERLVAGGKFKIPAIIVTVAFTGFLSYLTHQQNKTWMDAITFFERLRNFAPSSSRLHSDLGGAYFAKGRKEEAIESIKTAIRLRPNYYAAYSNLGTAYESIGETEMAIKAFEKAIEIRPDYANAHFNLGNVYKKKNMFKEAIVAFANSIKYSPNIPDAYNNIAISYSRIGEKKKAIEYYEKAIKINPHNNRFYNNLASAYSDMNNHKQAVELYEKALSMGPVNQNDKAIIYYNLCLGYFRLGNMDKFRENYNYADAISIQNKGAYQQLALIFQKLGLKNESNHLMKKALGK